MARWRSPTAAKPVGPSRVKGVGDLRGGAPRAASPRHRERSRDAVRREDEIPRPLDAHQVKTECARRGPRSKMRTRSGGRALRDLAPADARPGNAIHANRPSKNEDADCDGKRTDANHDR